MRTSIPYWLRKSKGKACCRSWPSRDLLGEVSADLRLDLLLSQGQDTQDGLEAPREKDPIFSWVGVNGFHQQKRCPKASAGAGLDSKDQRSSCLLGHGNSGAVLEGYQWEVRAKQVVQCSEVRTLFFPGAGVGYGSSVSRRGRGKWHLRMLENLGQEEMQPFMSTLSFLFSSCWEGRARLHREMGGKAGRSGRSDRG